MKPTVCSRWHNMSLVQAAIIKAFGWLAQPGSATICEFSCLVSDHERRDPARHGMPARPSTRPPITTPISTPDRVPGSGVNP